MVSETAHAAVCRGAEESQPAERSAVLDRLGARVRRRLAAERSAPEQVAGGSHGASLIGPLPQ
ncbi:HaaA family cyclophane-containing RiPP peptide [Streptomyces scabiei]|uniref:HaaA family cyclophane-containing RiPP peptide n=1 Tax=Streptomyces TaxID=1883 RepID=UPI00255C2B6B|nr:MULTISPECIES: HaaA family cyclophane-containing RiPP peptide [unclassified Streptomyces]